MTPSLRGRQPEAIPYLLGYSQYQPNTLLVVAGIASRGLAMTWREMKSLDEESAKILKSIKAML